MADRDPLKTLGYETPVPDAIDLRLLEEVWDEIGAAREDLSVTSDMLESRADALAKRSRRLDRREECLDQAGAPRLYFGVTSTAWLGTLLGVSVSIHVVMVLERLGVLKGWR